MWKVRIEDKAAKIFSRNALSEDDRRVIYEWAKLVRDHGPNELHKQPSMWADHELYDDWEGYRASSFSYKEVHFLFENNMCQATTSKNLTPGKQRRLNHDYSI